MKQRWRYILAAAAAAALFTFAAGLGLLQTAGQYAADWLYQSPCAVDGQILLVGIDQKALDRYGPYQSWGRERMAMLLDQLNADEEARPALIGIDVLYSGQTEAGEDEALAAAAGRYGNVLTACAGVFEPSFVQEGDRFIWDSFHITGYEQPYPDLQAVTEQGHINAMLDSDGVLRHHMLYLTLPDGQQVPSMALAIAQRYKEDLSLPAVDSHSFWYLPFSQKPGGYEMISAADVLDGRVPAGYFQDKIVLIGPYAPGLQDQYITSIDRAQLMYGIEYQANAIEALLSGDFKQEVPQLPQLLGLFLILTCAGILFWKLRMSLAAVLWLVLCGGGVLGCRLLYEAGWILEVLWLPVGLTVLYGGCLAIRAVHAALERQRAVQTFRRYVAPEVVTQLLAQGPEHLALGGQLTEISVLFVDIRGFTSMSEALEPPQVVEILNSYLTLTTDCIMRYHGTLDKFVGDCTMALWNAPMPQKDHCLLACQAALAMAEGVSKLSEDLQRKYGRSITFGIGVHTGPAVVGNIGAPMRMDYTAIGDTVNTASRLEANAPGGRIYISRAVVDRLSGQIQTSPVGKLAFKGKKEPFEVWSLDGILPKEESM